MRTTQRLRRPRPTPTDDRRPAGARPRSPGSVRVDVSHPDPLRVEPGHPESLRVEPGRPDPLRVEPGHPNRGRLTPARRAPGRPATGPRASAPLLRADSAERLAETADRLRATYRDPTSPTSSRRLAAACLWALTTALLGTGTAFAAVVVGLGALDGLAAALPSIAVACGLTGMTLTLGAFLSIGRRRTPWVLLGAATGTVLVLLVVVAAA